MKSYTDIFFDLDKTLWDYDRNSAETLAELYEEYGLYDDLGINLSTFVDAFREINAQSWREFRLGSQSKEDLRTNRFVQTFFKYGSANWKKARKMSLDYIEICPYKGNLVDGALEMLDSLSKTMSVHIITNGFSDTQRIKLQSSGIFDYFGSVIISDEVNCRKPDEKIFFKAVEEASTTVDQSIMIGDDWHRDIVGAQNAGMDQVYFNPRGLEKEGESTFEISELRQLEAILTPGG